MLNGVLESPMIAAPGVLVNAAPHAMRMGLSAMVGVVVESLWLAISVIALPIVWRHSRAMGALLVAIGAVIVALAAVENAAFMSQLSLSQAYLRAGSPPAEQFDAVRSAVSGARNWIHFLARIADGVAVLAFNVALFRYRLVPRWIAGLAFISAPLMLTSLALPFFGGSVIFPLLAPVGLTQLTLVVWLFAKGFAQPAPQNLSARG